MQTKPAKMMKPADAEKVAEDLNSDDFDDWNYVAVHDPKGTGWSFVSIYDEDGEFVGKI